LTFTGSNTYTGGTNISNTVSNVSGEIAGSVAVSYAQNFTGAVQLGASGTVGTLGAGDVVNNGVLLFNRTDTLALPNNISGSGLVVQTGSGETQLGGALTQTGGTRVLAGTLQVGNGATAGSVSGDIVNNSTVKYNRTDDQTVTSAISGTGALTKAGSNTLTLTSAQTYSGATAISAGQLIFQNNTRPTSTTFTGVGKLGIEPTLNGTFATALSTSTYSFASTLTGLSLGATSSTSALTVNSDLTIAGPISLYGAGVNINNNVQSTAAGATVLAKSTGNITLEAALPS
jgi:autotransporter-associated beta strand protein